ncbi:MAG: hypothetical protein R3A11_09680 [Bdellovibrionota bacterium]
MKKIQHGFLILLALTYALPLWARANVEFYPKESFTLFEQEYFHGLVETLDDIGLAFKTVEFSKPLNFSQKYPHQLLVVQKEKPLFSFLGRESLVIELSPESQFEIFRNRNEPFSHVLEFILLKELLLADHWKQLIQDRFGIKVSEKQPGEHLSEFQFTEFTTNQLYRIYKALRNIDLYNMVKNSEIHSIMRDVQNQVRTKTRYAAAISSGHHIVIGSALGRDGGLDGFESTIYHEMGHQIWHHFLSGDQRIEYLKLSWKLIENQGGGQSWEAYNTQFISEYSTTKECSHMLALVDSSDTDSEKIRKEVCLQPAEDFAEHFSAFFIAPWDLYNRAKDKFDFLSRMYGKMLVYRQGLATLTTDITTGIEFWSTPKLGSFTWSQSIIDQTVTYETLSISKMQLRSKTIAQMKEIYEEYHRLNQETVVAISDRARSDFESYIETEIDYLFDTENCKPENREKLIDELYDEISTQFNPMNLDRMEYAYAFSLQEQRKSQGNFVSTLELSWENKEILPSSQVMEGIDHRFNPKNSDFHESGESEHGNALSSSGKLSLTRIVKPDNENGKLYRGENMISSLTVQDVVNNKTVYPEDLLRSMLPQSHDLSFELLDPRYIVYPKEKITAYEYYQVSETTLPSRAVKEFTVEEVFFQDPEYQANVHRVRIDRRHHEKIHSLRLYFDFPDCKYKDDSVVRIDKFLSKPGDEYMEFYVYFPLELYACTNLVLEKVGAEFYNPDPERYEMEEDLVKFDLEGGFSLINVGETKVYGNVSDLSDRVKIKNVFEADGQIEVLGQGDFLPQLKSKFSIPIQGWEGKETIELEVELEGPGSRNISISQTFDRKKIEEAPTIMVGGQKIKLFDLEVGELVLNNGKYFISSVKVTSQISADSTLNAERRSRLDHDEFTKTRFAPNPEMIHIQGKE